MFSRTLLGEAEFWTLGICLFKHSDYICFKCIRHMEHSAGKFWSRQNLEVHWQKY